jgi:hypothetical protein
MRSIAYCGSVCPLPDEIQQVDAWDRAINSIRVETGMILRARNFDFLLEAL